MHIPPRDYRPHHLVLRESTALVERWLYNWLGHSSTPSERDNNSNNSAWGLDDVPTPTRKHLEPAYCKQNAVNLPRTASGQRKWVLQHGLNAITAHADPAQVLLRVESMEAALLPPNHSLKMIHETPSTDDDICTRTLRSFFAVEWGKPKLAQLEATKRLAESNTTITYAFLNIPGTGSISSPMRSYLERTAQHLPLQGKAPLHVQTRKVDSIQDRLIAYQASIG